ncbi:hypothetical protein [Pseudomonas amygdali]|uniref:hypothetical protein n=1 Tax=Pseudomonas amygdali TaxID=47877 RepID=UPI001C573B2D|nr:hypothetical protein [Pseudomonas amygdali]QXW42664.1 hypothetical protein KXJ79_12925 [Pseudomonas amygdali]
MTTSSLFDSVPVHSPVRHYIVEGVHVERFLIIHLSAASASHAEESGTWHPVALMHNECSQEASTLGVLFRRYLIEKEAEPVIIVRYGQWDLGDEVPVCH